MQKRILYSIITAFCLLCIVTYYSYQNDTGKVLSRSDVAADGCNDSEETLFGPCVKADSAKVVKRLRDVLMHKPSDMPYNLEKDDPQFDPSMGQSEAILSALDFMENGFFVECGALDGETRSNTLYMERVLGWKGVLIEGDPKNFELLLQKNRKAHSFPVCLSPHSYPVKLMFEQHFNIGKIAKNDKQGKDKVEVECYPLISILLAVGELNVDYFSLDVEGAEFKVLKAIPWEKVNIKTLSVEYAHDVEGKESIKEFMNGAGYDMVKEVSRADWLANDFIFVKR